MKRHLITASLVLAFSSPAWAAPILLPLQARFGGAFTGGVLDGVRSVAVSDDDAFVYTAAEYDNAVAVFGRSPGGDLAFVQVLHDGDGAIDGLSHADCVTLSPDGAHAYVSGFLDHAVATFSRNAVTGQLTFEDVVRDGVGGADGLRGAHKTAVSPDGKQVYVAAFYEDAIGVFDRDSVTGMLTFNQVVRDGVGGVDGLAGVLWVTLSPDGLFLYAAAAVDSAVAVFARDPLTGELTFIEAHKDGVSGVNGLGGARVTLVSPDGAHVYAASGGILVGSIDNAVAVFARNQITGTLTYVTSYFDGTAGISALAGGYDLAMTPDGASLYVAGFRDDSVVAFSRNASTGELTLVQEERDGVGGITRLGGAHGLALTSGGENLYTTAFDDDAVVVFALGGGGVLSLVEEDVEGTAVATRVEALALPPGGNQLYAAGFALNSVSIFPRDTGTGLLGVPTDVSTAALSGASGVTVTPDGAHVYATGRGANSLVGFSRDSGTGALTMIDSEFDGAGGVDGLLGARAVVSSPDGAHIYVAGEQDNAVAVFARDAVTGLLTFVEAQIDGASGADGLAGAHALAFSPDGAHLYVAGKAEDALAVFQRDAGTGKLTFVEAQRDGVGGVDGLDGAAGIAVSADGGQVYVAGSTDNAVAVFARNPVSGQLSFTAVHRDGVSEVEGLRGANGLSLSADGAYLFVASTVDDAVAVFARDTGTGALSFLTAEFDNAGSVNALRGSFAVVPAPVGGRLYVAAPDDNAVAVFELTSLCPDLPLTGCHQAPNSKLLMSDSLAPAGDRLSFSWLYGDETLPQVFGDPANGSTHYGLCIFDELGGMPHPLLALAMPRGGVCNSHGKACWRNYFGDYFYKDSERTPDGVKFMRLHWGHAGDPNVTLRAKGVHLPTLPAMPLVPPITAQVINTDGECWSTTFQASDVERNGALPSGRALFRAVKRP